MDPRRAAIPLRSRRLGLVAGLALAGAGPSGTAQGAPAEHATEALVRAAEHERAGDLRGAAHLLGAAASAHPGDYDLLLQLAWARFRLGDFARAEDAYRAALRAAPGSLDARLGLGWALVRQGRCADARAAFADVLAELPDHPGAARGRDACAKADASSLVPSAATTLQLYPDHPVLAQGVGVHVGLRGGRGGLGAGAAYRLVHYATTGVVDPWQQHEAHADAGYGTARAGASAQVAWVHDGSGAGHDSQHLGLSARYSPLGDLLLSASLSLFPDVTAIRVEPSWRLPLGEHSSVRPAVGLASVEGETLVTGLVTLGFERGALAAFLGGKYGDEVRPAYLPLGVAVITPARIRWGGWLGASLRASPALTLGLSYAADRIDWTTLAPRLVATAHYFTASASLALGPRGEP